MKAGQLGTECCGALIRTTTHQYPSWHTCVACGQPVNIRGGMYSVPCGGCGVPVMEWSWEDRVWRCRYCGHCRG